MIDSLAGTPSALLTARLSRRGLGTIAAGTLAALGTTETIARRRKRHRKRHRPGAQRPQLTFQFVTEWGSLGNGNGQFAAPTGIAIDSQDNVYVANSNANQIKKFTPA